MRSLPALPGSRTPSCLHHSYAQLRCLTLCPWSPSAIVRHDDALTVCMNIDWNHVFLLTRPAGVHLAVRRVIPHAVLRLVFVALSFALLTFIILYYYLYVHLISPVSSCCTCLFLDGFYLTNRCSFSRFAIFSSNIHWMTFRYSRISLFPVHIPYLPTIDKHLTYYFHRFRRPILHDQLYSVHDGSMTGGWPVYYSPLDHNISGIDVLLVECLKLRPMEWFN